MKKETKEHKYIHDGFFNIEIKPKKQPTVSFEYPSDLFYFYIEFEDGDILEINYIDDLMGTLNVFESNEEVKEYYGMGLEEIEKLSERDPAVYKDICDWISQIHNRPRKILEIYYAEA